MNLDYIETFYWAATFKSTSDAAKKMNIVPQAAAYRIMMLERSLKQNLVDRQERQFRLTRAGEKFLPEAKRLLELWRSVQSDGGREGAQASKLRIGAMESVLHTWLIPWLEHLRVDLPAIELELTVETTDGLHELVRRGSIDLVFSAGPMTGDHACTRAFPALRMVFVGDRQRHSETSYTLADLAHSGILTFQRGSQPHTQLITLLRQCQIDGARVHAISSVSAMLRLVMLGFGVATLPEAAMEALAVRGSLVPLCCETELVELPVNANWRADPSSQSIDSLVDSAYRFVASPRFAG
jgi:DNA-binding transcriptional LysR family regulator